MSLKTRKTPRWQALALAALVLAGGSIAVPQAASAAANSTTCTTVWFTGSCQVKIKAPYGVVQFRATATVPRGAKMAWNMKTASGKTLCKGTMTSGSWRSCSFSYRGTVTVKVSTGLSSLATISAFS